jgi:peptidoglycan/xylan/chitin deacetylase (PgdA/CDA1 family)
LLNVIGYKIKKACLKMNSLVSRVLPRAMVLIYHRVSNLESDPQRLSVTPENFDSHMKMLARRFHPISLRELVDDLRRGRVRDRAVVVTFDDGYEDNYRNARPMLEKYLIPATVFVSSGYTGSKREFWWDELDRLILGTRSLPELISVELNGNVCRWNVLDENDSAGVSSEKRYSQHEVYMDLCARFQQLDSGQVDSAIEELRNRVGDRGEGRPENMPMSVDQVRSLHEGGLIEIGAHTRSHVNFAAQTSARQQEEIEGSKQDLETMLGASIESFSYPFGTLDHYTNRSVECVKAAGFQNALANFSANVTRVDSLYEIPRRMIRNWDGITFENALDGYYSGQRITS